MVWGLPGLALKSIALVGRMRKRRKECRGGENATRSVYVVSRRARGRPQVARFASEQKLRLFSEEPLRHVSVCVVEI